MRTAPLPVEYTPFSQRTIQQGQTFAIRFDVQPASHQKTVARLFESVSRPPVNTQAYESLLPSEQWAMARVLSSAFGRLNELVLMRTAWQVAGRVPAGSPLSARTTIVSVRGGGRLPRCTTQTDTFDAAGTLLVRGDDDVLLSHDCEKPFYVERPVESAPVPPDVRYRARHVVYCRYVWDPSIWVNNIHTDEYARSCGFEGGLPEFPVYIDWVYHAAIQSGWISEPPFTIALRHILPMYVGETVEVVAYEEKDSLVVRFLYGGTDRLFGRVTPGIVPARRRELR
jgi:hypothetical protein